jgi:hypothetical protein
MAELKSFMTPSGTEVVFEVETAGGGGPSLADALRVISALGAAVVDEIASMPGEAAPEAVELSFGLAPTGAGGLAVTRGLNGASLRLTLHFPGDAGRSSDLPETP